MKRFITFLPSLLALLLLVASAYEWRRSVSQWDYLEMICPWFALRLQSEEAAGIVTWKPHPQGYWDVFTDSLPVQGEARYLSPLPLSFTRNPDGIVFMVPLLYTTIAAGLALILCALRDTRRWKRLVKLRADQAAEARAAAVAGV